MSAPDTPKPSVPESPDSFIDPIRDRRVQVGIVLLLVLLVPIWPLSGSLWGFPAWAVFAVFASLLTSGFISWVVLAVWRDPDNNTKETNREKSS
jgi:hypothetical protein